MGRYNRKFKKEIKGLSEETSKLLHKHDWPGNVRELKNAIERAMILDDENLLRAEYLPFAVGKRTVGMTAFEASSTGNGSKELANGRSLPKLSIPDGGTSLEEVERAFVEMALAQANGNQTQAAKLLDISRDALRYKLKKFGLGHPEDDEVQGQV
jgi:transcriptional regulator with PAS, ATPase and Fis domain